MVTDLDETFRVCKHKYKNHFFQQTNNSISGPRPVPGLGPFSQLFRSLSPVTRPKIVISRYNFLHSIADNIAHLISRHLPIFVKNKYKNDIAQANACLAKM